MRDVMIEVVHETYYEGKLALFITMSCIGSLPFAMSVRRGINTKKIGRPVNRSAKSLKYIGFERMLATFLPQQMVETMIRYLVVM